MLSKVSGTRIKGGYFEQECQFKMFNDEKDRIAIVYGKNGSGKSSISKGILEYSCEIANEYDNVDIIDYDDNTLQIPNELKKSIFVYNEGFIDNNIRLEENGLNTIIMLGEQVELDRQIKELNQTFVTKEKDFKKKENQVAELEDVKKVQSPLFIEQKMIKALKREGGWAAIDASIKDNKKNTAVKATTIETVYQSRTKKAKDEIYNELQQVMDLYTKAASGKRVNELLKKVPFSQSIMDTAVGLLGKKIKEPIVTEREEIIMKMLRDGKQNFVESSLRTFSDIETEICPYCLQSVGEDYKRALVASIEQVLNKDVDDHKKELRSIELKTLDMQLDAFQVIDNGLVNKLLTEQSRYNKIVTSMNDSIMEKINNVFVPVTNEQDFEGVTNNINRIIDEITDRQKTYNSNIDKVNEIQKRAIILNMQMAWYDIAGDYQDYLKQKNLLDGERIKCNTFKTELMDIKTEIRKKEAEKANISIALVKMNDYLDYIFFEKGRLSLEIIENKYVIRSRGKSIKLKNLSLGERNAIALCYFFSKIQENKAVEDSFSNQLFVVLDDPISSFDIENKVGIFSFLRYMVSEVIGGNIKSKVLIFTHEIEAMYHFIKLCSDIGIGFKKYNLQKKQLDNFTSKSHHEYSNMINMIYRYASNEEGYQELQHTIGNTMRRALEAFGTFSYKKPIDKLSCDKAVLESIDNEKQRKYFENLMYRLVLNSESHLEENTRSYPEYDFYGLIDEEEKIRTAKDIMCFIYLLNPLHLSAHLNNGKHLKKVGEWCKSLE